MAASAYPITKTDTSIIDDHNGEGLQLNTSLATLQ